MIRLSFKRNSPSKEGGIKNANPPLLLEEKEVNPPQPVQDSTPFLAKAWKKLNYLLHRRTVTIHVDGSLVRTVTFRGHVIEAWQTFDLARIGIKLPQPLSESTEVLPWSVLALQSRFRHRRARIVMCTPSQSSIIRRLQLRKVGRRYVKKIVQMELLNSIPFSMSDVDSFWKSNNNGTSKQIFSVSTPKRSIDDLIKPFKEAGVHPSALYAKAHALAIIAGIPNSIIADFGPSWVDIILVRDGYPEVVHRTEASPSDSSSVLPADNIAGSIEQISTYGIHRNGATDVQPLPVVFTGYLSDKEGLVQDVKARLKREFSPFTNPFDIPKGFPVHEYAVNLGLALLDYNRGVVFQKIFAQRAQSLNLLPERHYPPRLPALPTAVFGALFALGALSFVMTTQINSIESSQQLIISRVEDLERQERLQKIAATRNNLLDKRIKEVSKFSVAIQSLAEEKQAEVTHLLRQMRTATGTETDSSLPVQVSTLQAQSDSFLLTGNAPSYDAVLVYSAQLKESDLFQDIRVLRLEGTSDSTSADSGQGSAAGVVTFQIRASLKDVASGSKNPKSPQVAQR